MMNERELNLIPIRITAIVKTGDDISNTILSALEESDIQIVQGDIIVVTHSIVSISEGKLYNLDDVEVSERAKRIARNLGRSPERVEVAILESVEVLREDPVLITKNKQGIVTDFSGVDESNAPPGTLLALPDNPDESARQISDSLSSFAGFKIPVIISDTQGRPWRKGAVNLAIGVAGMSPFSHNVGKEDIHGYELRGSLVCLADQLASAAELVMGQADESVPVVIIRGVDFEEDEGNASSIIRSETDNLFS